MEQFVFSLIPYLTRHDCLFIPIKSKNKIKQPSTFLPLLPSSPFSPLAAGIPGKPTSPYKTAEKFPF